MIEERYELETMLREAILASQDDEALLWLAELIGDDLELWEQAHRCLADMDPRRAMVAARRKKLSLEFEAMA